MFKIEFYLSLNLFIECVQNLILCCYTGCGRENVKTDNLSDSLHIRTNNEPKTKMLLIPNVCVCIYYQYPGQTCFKTSARLHRTATAECNCKN